jgi:hypothetical protein
MLKKGLAVGIILLFTSNVIVMSTASIVTASKEPLRSLTIADNGYYTCKEKTNLRDIVWDNYVPSGGQAISSQFDTAYPFQSQVADDFFFNRSIQVTGIHWWGVFYGGSPPWPNPTDFNIIFYADDGTGNMPTGDGMNDPTSTALVVYFIPDVNGTNCGPYPEDFVYDVILPNPFIATANTKYWIAIQAKLDWPPQWGWYTNGNNPDQLHLPVFGFPELGAPYWTDVNPSYGGDMAFYLNGSNYPPPPPPKPDLDCNGKLSWTDIKPGATITGSFQVMNIGEQNSHLNWIITSYPDWGTWTFTPSSGANLTPQDGAITVDVTVIAPDIKNQEFQGQVTIVNQENSSDYCTIPVSLTTPFHQDLMHYRFFERLIKFFPYAFPILRHFLGY